MEHYHFLKFYEGSLAHFLSMTTCPTYNNPVIFKCNCGVEAVWTFEVYMAAFLSRLWTKASLSREAFAPGNCFARYNFKGHVLKSQKIFCT